MKRFFFLLLLLAPPPPALPQGNLSSTDKGLGNDEPPTLSGLFGELFESFLSPGDENDSHPAQPQKSQNATGGGGASSSSPEEEEDDENESTSAESSSEDVKQAQEQITSSGEKGTSKEGAEKSAVCPGACVSARLTENCEAILRTEGICTKDLECCVSKEKNKDNPDLVVVAPKKQCMGECRGLFGLFLCEEVDEKAFCPESHQSCCVFRPKPPPPSRFTEDSSENRPTQPPPPPQQTQPTMVQEPQKPPQQGPPKNSQQQQQPQIPPPNRRPPPPPPMYMPRPCPAYCLPHHLFRYCNRPLRDFPCGKNGFCCDHDLIPFTPTTPEPPSSEEKDPIEQKQTPAKGKQTANRPCPGSCISEILTFTCFLNAEMTDAYACPAKMKCCAPKKNLNTTTPTTEKTSLQTLRVFSTPTYPTLPPTTPGPANRVHYVCGTKGLPLGRRKRVVGGRDSSPGEWCWQVALINSLNQYLCGGALIGTGWVLTAAHCVTNIVRSGDAIYVRVGDHDLTSKYGSPGAQTLRVATTYIHHNHNSQTLDNDIALLKLQGNVVLKQGVCLVCLPSRSGKEIPGKRCTVTGYGYMGESGPIPLRVREAELPIVGEHECIEKVNAVTEKRFVLPASSFCAGGEFKNDACQGDGGGPLVCKEQDGVYELTGLVSWGFGCGRQDVPGVYVKVSSFIGWINQIISVNAGSVA